MTRDSAIIYRSFYEAISELPKENQAELWNAVFELAFNFKEVPLNGISATIFKLIKPQIEANNRRFENGNKPKSKQEGSKPQANPEQEDSKPGANNNKNNNRNKNKNPFSPPSLLEFENYFEENGFPRSLGARAWKGYDAANWKDSEGKQINNWKQKCQHVWFKEENKIPDLKNETLDQRAVRLKKQSLNGTV